MIQKLFAVYDSKALCFTAPYTAVNREVGLRVFYAAVNHQGSQMFAHPEDFTLFEVGEWDDETGVLTPKQHASLGLASSFKLREIDRGQRTPQSLSDEAPVQPGAKGGNSEKHVRP